MLNRIGEALSGLNDYLSLKRPLAADSPADEDDVLTVKKDLNRSGYYDEPDYGMTPYPDKLLFEGIRAFQKDNGLTVDGIMNPGGETEAALNRNRVVRPDPLEGRARDENIMRQFIQARNEQRTQTAPSDPVPPVPKRKPERKDDVRLKAEKQGEFVGDVFADLATGRLKRIPVKNPVFRKALSKALGVSEDIISYIPEKLWTSIAEKQMREKKKKNKDTD